jgi:O-antigen/teichoic acid export membrane protein
MSSRSNGDGHASTPDPDAGLWQALRRKASEPLLRNGLFIMGTTAVTSLLGFAFWLIAARLLPTAAVGQAAALISAMLFVSVITNLGIGQVLISRLGSRGAGPEWSLTVSTGLATTAVASLLGGLLAALLLPVLVPELKEGVGPAVFAMFPFGVAAVACSLVIDFACIAEREARPSFLRNAAAAVLRLALIGVAAALSLDSPGPLVAFWVVSFLLIDALGLVRTLPGLGRSFRPTLRGWRRELTAIRRLIAGHQSINLGSQASAYLLPVIVSARLGATENAYFYATFMVCTALFFIAPAIANSLFAEGARSPHTMHRDLRRAGRYIAILAIPPALILLIAGPSLLRLFGEAYSEAGTGLLYVLIGSAVLDAGYQLAIAVLRADGRLGEAAVATWILLITGILSAWLLLPPLGLIGAGVGWAIGKACGLAATLILPLVRGTARPNRPRDQAPS